MRKSVLARLGLGILLSIILFWVWYSVYANNDYGALAGTYVFDGNGEKCTLYLRPDRTFAQELSRSGEIQKSQGQWHRYGQAHVSFSNEFLKLSGEEMNASGEAHGQFDKTLGIFPTLTLAPLPNGPQFHKKLFHLADAIHTVEDYTSPTHTSASGDPLPWNGFGAISAASHWSGEHSPDEDWSAIGFAMRLTMSAYLQTNPKGAAEHGLTEQTFESEWNKNVSNFVHWFYSNNVGAVQRGASNVYEFGNPIAENAADQCAHGNRAACGAP